MWNRATGTEVSKTAGAQWTERNPHRCEAGDAVPRAAACACMYCIRRFELTLRFDESRNSQFVTFLIPKC